MQKKHFLTKIFLFISFVLLLSSCLNEDESPTFEETTKVKVGDSIPKFCVNLLDGRTMTTDSLLTLAERFGEKEVKVVLFNTTCEDCQRELEVIEQSYTAATLCISREQTEAEVKSYWQDHHLTIPCAAVEDRSVYDLFATMYIPRTYVANTDGIITIVK